jgi:hypothetical protein
MSSARASNSSTAADGSDEASTGRPAAAAATACALLPVSSSTFGLGGEDRLCLSAQEGGPGRAVALGYRIDPGVLKISHTVEGTTRMLRVAS